MVYAPNILTTNHCNQNCPFCFARKEMAQNSAREMDLAGLESLYRKTQAMGKYPTVKLLGGEPTIHSHFNELILLSLRYFESVQIFTNGMMRGETVDFLNTHGGRIKYTFNIMTPGFILNKKIRQLVLQRIGQIHTEAEVSVALTVDPYTPSDILLRIGLKSLFGRLASIRVGLSNPIAGEKNPYTFDDFPRIGTMLVHLIRQWRGTGYGGRIVLNCGLTRCMFTDSEFGYVTENAVLPGLGCFGKQSSMDVGVDMKAFHCFPLAETKKYNCSRASLTTVAGRLVMERLALWKKTEKEVCRTCPFYGMEEGKCPGPCIAFRINELGKPV